jgi:hypothetical protein
VEIEKIIALHRFALHQRKLPYRILLIGHALFLLFFKRYKSKHVIINGKEGPKFLFFKALHRFDYDALFSKISSCCEFEKQILEVNLSFGVDFSFFNQILSKISQFNKIESDSNVDKVYLFLSYLFYTKIIKSIQKFEFDILVVFADMQPVDNLLVQFYKNKNIPTVTLQHGLFVDYEGTFNISSVSYKNVVSDHFLSWGEGNKHLINRHNPDCNILVCGNPMIQNIQNKFKNENFFTVVLDWDVFEEENIKMLDVAKSVAEEMEINFQIRYHPSNNPNKYYVNSNYLIENKLDYMDSRFILGHTSSLIHVAFRLGKTVFKFKSNIASSPIDESCVIESSQDIKILLNKQQTKYIQIGETINIGPIGTKSLNQYKLFFEGLL